MDLMYFLELAINGGLAGLMYSLVAMGIVLIYKSSSVPNLAQGALTMVGAYVVIAFAEPLGLPMWLARHVAGDELRRVVVPHLGMFARGRLRAMRTGARDDTLDNVRTRNAPLSSTVLDR